MSQKLSPILLRDAKEFFNLSADAYDFDLDELFFTFISSVSNTPTPLRLVYKYKRKYHPALKNLILRYIYLTLTEDFDKTCNNPAVLISPLTSLFSETYYNFLDCLSDLSELKDDSYCNLANIFVYLLYVLSANLSKKRIVEDQLNEYEAIKFICNLEIVKKELEKEVYWGIVDDRNYKENESMLRSIKRYKSEIPKYQLASKKASQERRNEDASQEHSNKDASQEHSNKDASQEHSNKDASQERRNEDASQERPNKDASQERDTRDDSNYSESLQTTVSFLNFIDFTAYRAYQSKSLLPFFLEGAFEPFPYLKTDAACRIFFDIEGSKTQQVYADVLRESQSINKFLYDILFNLVRSSKKRRSNFTACITRIYENNKDRQKIMYDINKYASDGFCINIGNVIDKFTDKIFVDKMESKVDFMLFNRISDDDKDENESIGDVEIRTMARTDAFTNDSINKTDAHKIDTSLYNEFISIVCVYNVLFLNIGYVKILNDGDEIARDIDRVNERTKKVLESKMSAIKALTCNRWFEEKTVFIDFLIDKAMQIEEQALRKTTPSALNASLNESTDNLSINHSDSPGVESPDLPKNLMQPATNTHKLVMHESFYKPIKKLKIFMTHYSRTSLSSNFCKLSEIVLCSSLNIHAKEEFLCILYYNPIPLSKKLFLSLCDIYSATNSFDLNDKYKIRTFINFLIKSDENKQIQRLDKKGIRFVSSAIKDLEFALGKALDAISKIKTDTELISKFDNRPIRRVQNITNTRHRNSVSDIILELDTGDRYIALRNTNDQDTDNRDEDNDQVSQGINQTNTTERITGKLSLPEDIMDILTAMLNAPGTLSTEQFQDVFERINGILNDEAEENSDVENAKKRLEDNILMAKNFLYCTQESLEMILFISKNNTKLLAYDESRHFLTNTLNYNLKLLVGPKCSSLSVKNMEKYNFRPKELLRTIMLIFCELNNPNILESITNGKDFNINLFKRAFKIISEKGIILESRQLEKLDDFLVSLTEQAEKQMEDDEVVWPPEFCDPLTFEVMKNPVKLLTSNVTVDKSTFDLIMVGDGIDPFNREKLDSSKVVEDLEMKKSIEEFINSHHK